jgi:hypothetical protein
VGRRRRREEEKQAKKNKVVADVQRNECIGEGGVRSIKGGQLYWGVK